MTSCKVGNIEIGSGRLALIAGPCVIESRDSALRSAEALKKETELLNIPFIFKASYDKANRSSVSSFRGPGLEEGLKVLEEVKREIGLPVLSDVHTPDEVPPAAEVLDMLQIPAFLCRQTDLVVQAAQSGKAINIKKGQFLSPEEMGNIVEKASSAGCSDIILTERGTFFGYNSLVNDFRALVKMRMFGHPVAYDATHSVQRPGGRGSSSGGESCFVEPLSLAAVATGACDAVFIEVHEDPARAKSDGPNMLSMKDVGPYLRKVKGIFEARRAL